VRLERAARALHDPDAVAARAVVSRGPVTTVGGLLELMRRHHLQFASAETPAGGSVYRGLYEALVRQRALLTAAHRDGPPSSPEAAEPPPGAVAALDGGA
jgi:hypothetical protein